MRELKSVNEIDYLGIPYEIQELDFERIKYKLSLKKKDDGQDWDREKIQLAELEYRRYLTLIKNNPTLSIVPSKLMDEFWHMHILDTKAYREDCFSVFGRFIDHFPYFGIYGDEDRNNLLNSFDNTKRLYKETFGLEPIDANASRCQDHPCHVPSECACRAAGTCKN